MLQNITQYFIRYLLECQDWFAVASGARIHYNVNGSGSCRFNWKRRGDYIDEHKEYKEHKRYKGQTQAAIFGCSGYCIADVDMGVYPGHI